MSDIYIARRGESLRAETFVMPGLRSDAEAFKDACALLEECNADCRGAHTAGGPTPLLFPGDRHGAAFGRQRFLFLKGNFNRLPNKSKEALAEIGIGESFSILEAIRSWKRDHIPENYGAYNLSADINTLGGGGFAVASGRATTLVKKMHGIEALLTKYATATGQEKRSLRPQIKQAYEALQKNFGPVIQNYLNQARAHNKPGSRIFGANRAMRLSGKSDSAPLTAKTGSLLRVARNFKYITRGLTGLDIGIRLNNWRNSRWASRTFLAESAGFVMSMGVGLGGAHIGVGLVLGPVGWVVLLVGTGVAAVGADYLFKDLAGSAYDDISSWLLLR